MDISVIVPIYNVENYLNCCLKSLEKAVRQIDAEVILVDDGSTDKSTTLAKSFSDTHEKFSYWRKENGGLSSARNFGITKAQGDYLAFIDADDFVRDTIFSDMLNAAKAQHADFATCNATRVTDKGTYPISLMFQTTFGGMPTSATNIRKNHRLLYDTSMCNKLIRTSWWHELGISFPEGMYFEDGPTSLVLHWNAERVAMVHTMEYFWRLRTGGSLSITQRLTDTKVVDDKVKMLERMLGYLSALTDDPDAESLIQSMRRKIVCTVFEMYFDGLSQMEDDQRASIVNKIGLFFQEAIDEETLAAIPAYHRAKYQCVVDGDIERLLRLNNHRLIAWRKAGVRQEGRAFKVQLPDELYGCTSSDAALELQYDQPLTKVEHVTLDGTKISMSVSVYYPRISVAQKDSQVITPLAYEEITGKSVILTKETVELPYLYGTNTEIVSLDDYRSYRYDYRWSGVKTSFDLEELARCVLSELVEGEPQRWLLFFGYDTPIAHDARILRGATPAARRALTANPVEFELDGHPIEARMVFDERSTFAIELRIVERIPEEETSTKLDNDHDGPSAQPKRDDSPAQQEGTKTPFAGRMMKRLLKRRRNA